MKNVLRPFFFFLTFVLPLSLSAQFITHTYQIMPGQTLNDSIPPGLFDSIVSVAQPTNGTLTYSFFNSNTSFVFSYTPNTGFIGTDTIEVLAYSFFIPGVPMDFQLLVEVIDTSVIPTAEDDFIQVSPDISFTYDILANDLGYNPTASIVSFPNNGTAIIDSMNQLVYTPNVGYTGNDTLQYQLCSSLGCDTATVFISVEYVYGFDERVELQTEEGISVIFDESAMSPFPPLGFSFVYQVTALPQDGQVVIHQDTTILDPMLGTNIYVMSAFEYIPDPNFVGQDSFVVIGCSTDPSLNICVRYSFTVDVYAAGSFFALMPDSFTILPGATSSLPVLGNDVGIQLSITNVSQPVSGTVAIDPSGTTVSYTAAGGFLGTDTFTYTACDLNNNCATETVTILVDTTTAIFLPISFDTPEDTPLYLDFGGSGMQAPDIILPPMNGTASFETGPTTIIDPVTNSPVTLMDYIVYQPDSGFLGTDQFVVIGALPGLPFHLDITVNVLDSTFFLRIVDMNDMMNGTATSIDPDVLDSQISLYPNPVSEVLTINSTETSLESVELMDIQGRVLMKHNLNRETIFNWKLDTLPEGIYMIRIQTPDGILTKRILRQ